MRILVIAIGPVQEFIESARKCRDLWFGSWLLSELARAAAKGIVQAEGAPEAEVLVFPGAPTSDKGRAVANKIVARVSKNPSEIAESAEKAMRARLAEIRDEAFGKVAPRRQDRLEFFMEKIAAQQVDDLIEFLWAAASEQEPGGYTGALAEAERLLAAVKNSKHWKQPTWAQDGVPKSSLDGIRESVLHESLYDNPRNDSAPRGISDGRRRREFGVHGAERLCGVGLLKRFGSDKAYEHGNAARIFSTSHVASGSFRAGLGKLLRGKDTWDKLVGELDKIDRGMVDGLDVTPRSDPTTGNVDGSVFFEGRLVETLEELGYDARTEKASFDRSRKALREFLRQVKPALGEPTPYYALLLADGDRMGKAISELKEFKAHRSLSEQLESFASSTRKIVQDEHEGALIYAGGDDVLALLPLHTLMACARQLADEFAKKMAPWKVREPEGERSPTLSMGVSVVHHLLPLDEALALVRRTEKVAKGVPGKNALAIVVKKRGGEPIEVSGSWGEIDARIKDLVELHRNDAISIKTQYELMDLAVRLEDTGGPESKLSKVREAETRRILARKQPRQGTQKKIAQETHERLAQLGAFSNPARLGRELYVAHLLAQAMDQAEPAATVPETHQEARS